MVYLTEQQIDDIAQKAADKAVECYLIKMGIEVDDPRDMQADMIFIRNFRKSCEAVGTKVTMVIVGVLTLGVLGGIAMAIKKMSGF